MCRQCTDDNNSKQRAFISFSLAIFVMAFGGHDEIDLKQKKESKSLRVRAKESESKSQSRRDKELKVKESRASEGAESNFNLKR